MRQNKTAENSALDSNITWVPHNQLSVPRVDIVWNKVVGLLRALALNERLSATGCSSEHTLLVPDGAALELMGI